MLDKPGCKSIHQSLFLFDIGLKERKISSLLPGFPDFPALNQMMPGRLS
jgi:hypothetical protein